MCGPHAIIGCVGSLNGSKLSFPRTAPSAARAAEAPLRSCQQGARGMIKRAF